MASTLPEPLTKIQNWLTDTVISILPMNGSNDNKKPAAEPTLATSVCGHDLPSCLFNSSNPFATNLSDLVQLDESAAGAVATRTACPGFVHDDATMKWAASDGANTINCLGYSPNSFEYYCENLPHLSGGKPAWMSISGYAAECAAMIAKCGELAKKLPGGLAVEINLSCPNIPGKPPIAYDFEGMAAYLDGVFADGAPPPGVVVGVKTTPYFYEQQVRVPHAHAPQTDPLRQPHQIPAHAYA